jgi:hypothetical protein
MTETRRTSGVMCVVSETPPIMRTEPSEIRVVEGYHLNRA